MRQDPILAKQQDHRADPASQDWTLHPTHAGLTKDLVQQVVFEAYEKVSRDTGEPLERIHSMRVCEQVSYEIACGFLRRGMDCMTVETSGLHVDHETDFSSMGINVPISHFHVRVLENGSTFVIDATWQQMLPQADAARPQYFFCLRSGLRKAIAEVGLHPLLLPLWEREVLLRRPETA